MAFITILATPTLVQNEGRFLRLASRLSPKALVNFCTLYSQWIDTVRLSLSRSVFLKLAKKTLYPNWYPFSHYNGDHHRGGSGVPPDCRYLTSSPCRRTYFSSPSFYSRFSSPCPFLVDTMRNLNVLVWLFSDTALSRPAFQQFSKGIYRSAFNGLILLILLMFYGSMFLLVAAKALPYRIRLRRLPHDNRNCRLDILEEARAPAPQLGDRRRQVHGERSAGSHFAKNFD